MKDHIFTRFWLLLALLPLLAVLQGCPGNDDPPIKDEEAEKIAADPDYKAKDYLRKEYMDVYYYWRDQVKSRNANFKPYDYDIYDFFDIMLYQKDRWSWMCDKEYYVSSETGVYTGTWGVSLDQAVEMGDYSIYIRYIYPGSPFEQYGVTRGAKITHINGVNVMDDESGFTREKLNYFNENYNKSPQTFTFRLADGRDTTFTAQKAMSLSTHPVLITRVYQPDEFPGLAEPVGYFHYLSFLGSEVFLEEIDNAMKTLHDAGVKKAIIDLRYNGGGDSRASQRLIDYLAPKSAEGKTYVVRKHNSYVASDMDMYSDIIASSKSSYAGGDKTKETYWDKVFPNRLDLDGIYFITGDGTASASEMVMNGLRPFMGDKLQMVGDTTYGKPNGMYVLMYPGSDSDYERYNNDDYTNLKWVFLPICFYNMNGNGEQIPDDGFVPNSRRPDDLFHDFGVQEDLIKACLSHIVSGSYPAVNNIPTKAAGRTGARLQREEDAPGYGLYMVRRADFFVKK